MPSDLREIVGVMCIVIYRARVNVLILVTELSHKAIFALENAHQMFTSPLYPHSFSNLKLF